MTSIVTSFEHVVDADVCVLDAADSVRGRALPPDNVKVLRAEGWIWASQASHRVTLVPCMTWSGSIPRHTPPLPRRSNCRRQAVSDLADECALRGDGGRSRGDVEDRADRDVGGTTHRLRSS